MVKKYKCIIFDLDGTILNTQRMNLLPLQKLIKEEKGIDLDYDSLIKYTCYPGKKTLGLLEFEDIETSYDKWVKYVNEFEEIATIYDGFNKVIKTLHEKGIICGIASSKMKKQYEIDFIPTGLDKYMQSVVLEEDTKNHKPHPEPLLKAIELFNVSPDECMYIGDTIVDYKSSKSAGMDFGLAVWGAANLDGIEADYNLEHPTDLLRELGII